MAELLSVLDEESLATKLQEVTTGLGFDRFVLNIEIIRPVVGRIHHIVSGCPLNWLKSPTTGKPIDRGSLPAQGSQDAAFNLRLPVHDKAGISSQISLAREMPMPTDAAAAQHLYNNAQILSACAHMATVRTLVPILLGLNDPKLSAREKECVTWAAHGKTSEEIGVKLHISEPTVVFHINKVVRKLGVRNRMHAVALSVAMGLVT